jgi:hypothetical protein
MVRRAYEYYMPVFQGNYLDSRCCRRLILNYRNRLKPTN